MLIKLPGATGDFGEVVVTGELHGGPAFTRSYPTYTCGHCTRIVAMRVDRKRPRKTCPYCTKMVCDAEICDPMAAGCTPVPNMAADHYEGAGPLAKRIRAIMRGATTLREVDKLGEPDGSL